MMILDSGLFLYHPVYRFRLLFQRRFFQLISALISLLFL